MDEIDFEAFCRRAIACPRWRWLSGMLLLGSDDQRVRQRDADWWNESPSEFSHLLPDLRDPCTMGGLLALVRDAWGEEIITCEWTGVSGAPWCVRVSWRNFEAASEAEALVAALESAT